MLHVVLARCKYGRTQHIVIFCTAVAPIKGLAISRSRMQTARSPMLGPQPQLTPARVRFPGLPARAPLSHSRPLKMMRGCTLYMMYVSLPPRGNDIGAVARAAADRLPAAALGCRWRQLAAATRTACGLVRAGDSNQPQVSDRLGSRCRSDRLGSRCRSDRLGSRCHRIERLVARRHLIVPQSRTSLEGAHDKIEGLLDVIRE